MTALELYLIALPLLSVIGVGKGNRAYIARSKRRRRRQDGQCRDRSHYSSRSLFE
jgi:hypothetical protein